MLFGHQDDVNRASEPATAPSVDVPAATNSTTANPLAVDPATGVSLPVAPPEDTMPAGDNPLEEPSVLDQPPVAANSSSSSFVGDPAPTTPFGSNQATTVSDTPATQPDPLPATSSAAMPDSSSMDEPTAPTNGPAPSFSDYTASTPTPAPSGDGDDLLNIKQQALSQLGPLVSHLDQTPEEKFRTTMMLIQSTDNAALLKNAYEAAQAITDEKLRAQALLDVVNEINYFTQQTADNAQPQSI